MFLPRKSESVTIHFISRKIWVYPCWFKTIGRGCRNILWYGLVKEVKYGHRKRPRRRFQTHYLQQKLVGIDIVNSILT